MITRRAAIAATLFGYIKAAGGQDPKTSKVTSIAVLVEINDEVPSYGPLTGCKPSEDGKFVECDAQKAERLDYALVVRYRGREVRFTPNELMDALEGK